MSVDIEYGPSYRNAVGNRVRSFTWHGKTCEVENKPCDESDTAAVMAAIISQATKDFLRLADPMKRKTPLDKAIYESARIFLFDDNNIIDWGNEELSLKDMIEFTTTTTELSLRKLRRQLVEQAHLRHSGLVENFQFIKQKADLDLLLDD